MDNKIEHTYTVQGSQGTIHIYGVDNKTYFNDEYEVVLESPNIVVKDGRVQGMKIVKRLTTVERKKLKERRKALNERLAQEPTQWNNPLLDTQDLIGNLLGGIEKSDISSAPKKGKTKPLGNNLKKEADKPKKAEQKAPVKKKAVQKARPAKR